MHPTCEACGILITQEAHDAAGLCDDCYWDAVEDIQDVEYPRDFQDEPL